MGKFNFPETSLLPKSLNYRRKPRVITVRKWNWRTTHEYIFCTAVVGNYFTSICKRFVLLCVCGFGVILFLMVTNFAKKVEEFHLEDFYDTFIKILNRKIIHIQSEMYEKWYLYHIISKFIKKINKKFKYCIENYQ